VMMPFDVGPSGEHVDDILDRLETMAKLGVTLVHGGLAGVSKISPIELMGERVIPAAAAL